MFGLGGGLAQVKWRQRRRLAALEADDGKIIRVAWPLDLLLLLPQALELHGQDTLFDFIGWEGLELPCESDLVHAPDEPLCRVVLVPLDGVAIVCRELGRFSGCRHAESERNVPDGGSCDTLHQQ